MADKFTQRRMRGCSDRRMHSRQALAYARFARAACLLHTLLFLTWKEHIMASSTLDPDNIPEPDRQLGKGHGTDALGPSDISDSGSDVQGGLRWTNEADIGLDKGTNEDPDSGRRQRSAGPDLGDANLDSDTDSVGTGEHASAGRDSDIEAGSDINVDRIDDINLEDNPDIFDSDAAPPRPRNPPGSQARR